MWLTFIVLQTIHWMIFYTGLNNHYSQVDCRRYEKIILGDFNVNFNATGKWTDLQLKSKVTRLFALIDIHQLICSPTRITSLSKTTIDLIFVNSKHRIVESDVLHLAISGHSLVYCIMKSDARKSEPRTIEYRSFKHYDKNAFINYLSDVPWSIIDGFEDVDDAFHSWTKLFNDVAEKHAPIKTRRVQGTCNLWMTKQIFDLMRERDFHHRKAQGSKSGFHWNNFRTYRNLVRTEIKKSKSDYYIKLIEESKGNSSKLWSAIWNMFYLIHTYILYIHKLRVVSHRAFHHQFTIIQFWNRHEQTEVNRKLLH